MNAGALRTEVLRVERFRPIITRDGTFPGYTVQTLSVYADGLDTPSGYLRVRAALDGNVEVAAFVGELYAANQCREGGQRATYSSVEAALERLAQHLSRA